MNYQKCIIIDNIYSKKFRQFKISNAKSLRKIIKIKKFRRKRNNNRQCLM